MAMRCRPDKDLLLEEDDMALANVVMQEAQKKIISQVRFKGSGCLPEPPARPCFEAVSDPGTSFPPGKGCLS